MMAFSPSICQAPNARRCVPPSTASRRKLAPSQRHSQWQPRMNRCRQFALRQHLMVHLLNGTALCSLHREFFTSMRARSLGIAALRAKFRFFSPCCIVRSPPLDYLSRSLVCALMAAVAYVCLMPDGVGAAEPLRPPNYEPVHIAISELALGRKPISATRFRPRRDLAAWDASLPIDWGANVCMVRLNRDGYRTFISPPVSCRSLRRKGSRFGWKIELYEPRSLETGAS